MDQNQRDQIGQRVRTVRAERGWSQARLAEAAGVSENTVLSIEKGRLATQPTKLRAVLDALGLATPTDGVLDLEGVPEDARVFLKVAAQRLKVLPEDRRARVLADIYPRLLIED
jgi:transcriptional regulator with XRE-family HTH domain